MDDENGIQDVGSVSVFQHNGTVIRTDTARKIVPDDGVRNQHFGSHVAVNSEFVVVSANEDGEGSVYIYDVRKNFKFVQKLRVRDGNLFKNLEKLSERVELRIFTCLHSSYYISSDITI